MPTQKRPSSLAGRIPRRSNLGFMLLAYRTLQMLSVRDLATRTGVSYATLNRIERGQGMDADTWLKLQGWMLAGSPEPTK